MPFVDNEATGTRYHSTRVNLRWSDFDQFQHVNNASYLEFSQDARIDFVRDVLTEMDISVPAFIVRWASVDYRKPLSSSDTQVLIQSFMYELGEKSFKMRQYIRNGQHKIVAVVDTVNVGVDIMTGKSRPWNESDINAISMFMIPLGEDGRDEDSLAVPARRDAGTGI